MKKETKKTEETAPAPTPINRMTKPAMVKVRAQRPMSEEIEGVMYRFTTGDEFEIPQARVAGLGPLVQILTVLLLLCAVAAFAAPVGLVAKTATGTTSATVMFAGGNLQRPVVTLDVTSDKAGSVASWRYGTTPFRLATPIVNGTNFYFYSSSLTTNDVFFAQNAADAVTNYTVWGTNALTNAVLELDRPLGTNLVAGDTVRKFTSTLYVLTNDASATTTNYSVSLTNGLAANDVLAIESDNIIYVGTLHSVLSNSINFTATLATNLSANLVFRKLTNSHPVVVASPYTSSEIVAVNATNLATGDILLVSPASGGHTKYIYNANHTLNLAKVMTTAAGITLAADDHCYLRGGTNSTPVGAATVRLYGTIFVLPDHRPAQLVLDGTSACTINSVIVQY